MTTNAWPLPGQAAGAAFVKTSTGFAATGATVADVRLMRDAVGPAMRVKASGGIRTLADALALSRCRSRLGTSATAAILERSLPKAYKSSGAGAVAALAGRV